ncbi:MAG: response regulator [Elusimicrobiota bacterium]
MENLLRALLVEDSEDDADLVLRELERSGYLVQHERVQTAAEMEAALDRRDWDVILSDFRLPQFDGLQALAVLQKTELDIPFIILSGTIGEETAVEAMRKGVSDYILKGNLKRLAPAIERERREARERRKRRQAEEALRQSEIRLLQAQKMEAVGRLAGGVAHDFNNLLTAVLGYTDLALYALKPEDPLSKDMEEIKKCAQRAAVLTRQLLAFGRQQVLLPKVVDLNAVIQDLSKMIKRLIPENIAVVPVLAADLGRIKADRGQLEQIIVNLAANARDAMPGGGRLTIETANARLDGETSAAYPEVKEGPYVMLAVRDTGSGMDSETRKRIFEPFFTTKPAGRGAGLGLATVYGIIKQSGGHIFVDSEVGSGTAFRIYFPLVEAREEAGPRAEEAPPAVRSFRGSETVLVVEDEESVRELTRRVLAQNGYRVLDAPNAGEALLVCEKHRGPVDIMLTDIVLPRMSGRELADRLAPLHPEMRVLYMTGYTDPAVIQEEVLDHGKPLILKPFEPETLLKKMREALEKNRRRELFENI